MIYINTVCEDVLSENVLFKTVNSIPDKFSISNKYITNGNTAMRKNLAGYNQASKFTPFCVLADLDKVECPPALISTWMNGLQINPNLIFRVAVKEVETWVLSDAIGFSAYSGIKLKYIPSDVEMVIDPKRKLLELVEKYAKKKVREDLLPRYGQSIIGPTYNLSLSNFVLNDWDVNRARANSPSLDGLVTRLENYTHVPNT